MEPSGLRPVLRCTPKPTLPHAARSHNSPLKSSLCTKPNMSPLSGAEGWRGAWCEQRLGAHPCFPLVLSPGSPTNLQHTGMTAAALHVCIGPHGVYCRGDCLKLILTTYIPKSPSNQDLHLTSIYPPSNLHLTRSTICFRNT